MAMTLNGKTPAVVVLHDGDVMTLYNDVVQYDVDELTLNNTEKVEDENTENDEDDLFTAPPPTINNRCLMFVRSQARRVVEPIRFVAVSPDEHFNGNELNPLYEVINPEIKTIDNSDSAMLVFWTNFIEEVDEYDAEKVLKFKEDNLVYDGGTVFRALCSTVIQFEKYYIQGGAVAKTNGDDPSTLDDDITNTYDMFVIATKPTIMQIYKDDYPVIDFASGGNVGGSGLRRHTHASNEVYDGGYSFSIMHPGTGVPQKPWEV